MASGEHTAEQMLGFKSVSISLSVQAEAVVSYTRGVRRTQFVTDVELELWRERKGEQSVTNE